MITPDEVDEAKRRQIPAEVFEVFDELIVQYWNGRRSQFDASEAINRLKSKGIDPTAIENYNYLDVEPFYRAVGWKVTYNSGSDEQGGCNPCYHFCRP